jgi:hypothetical protein
VRKGKSIFERLQEILKLAASAAAARLQRIVQSAKYRVKDKGENGGTASHDDESDESESANFRYTALYRMIMGKICLAHNEF